MENGALKRILERGGNDLNAEVVRFRSEDVIATSPVLLTAGKSYVTSYDEFIEGGGVYNYNYAIIRFMYDPGEEDHMAVYGAGGSGSASKFSNYTYAWYNGSRGAWVTEEKARGEYGGSFPT